MKTLRHSLADPLSRPADVNAIRQSLAQVPHFDRSAPRPLFCW